MKKKRAEDALTDSGCNSNCRLTTKISKKVSKEAKPFFFVLLRLRLEKAFATSFR